MRRLKEQAERDKKVGVGTRAQLRCTCSTVLQRLKVQRMCRWFAVCLTDVAGLGHLHLPSSTGELRGTTTGRSGEPRRTG
jgi:hypothetical protein